MMTTTDRLNASMSQLYGELDRTKTEAARLIKDGQFASRAWRDNLDRQDEIQRRITTTLARTK